MIIAICLIGFFGIVAGFALRLFWRDLAQEKAGPVSTARIHARQRGW